MLAQLYKLGVQSADVAELRGAEFGEVCVNIEPQDGVLLAVPLQAGDLGLELAVRLLSLRACSVVSLGLLGLRWSVLMRLLWLLLLAVGGLRRLGRITASHCGLLRMVSVRRRGIRAVLRVVVAHVAILLGPLAVR